MRKVDPFNRFLRTLNFSVVIGNFCQLNCFFACVRYGRDILLRHLKGNGAYKVYVFRYIDAEYLVMWVIHLCTK